MRGLSVHVFFDFSAGLRAPVTVPAGTLKRCQEHVEDVETTLGYEVTRYLDNPAHWRTTTPRDGVTDAVFCHTASRHNRWVRMFYEDLARWSKEPPADGVPLTPLDAQTFWHGLQQIDVPAARWTVECYRERMEHGYEVLRGRESEGCTLGEKPLTTRQAAAVINLFSFLDPDDLRLDVPKGHDRLESSSDGGYVWCESCGAMDPDDATACRKRSCPVREEMSL